jgi:hypothetical protein
VNGARRDAAEDVPKTITHPVLLFVRGLAPDAAQEVVNQGVNEGEVELFGGKQETVVTRAPELVDDHPEVDVIAPGAIETDFGGGMVRDFTGRGAH